MPNFNGFNFNLNICSCLLDLNDQLTSYKFLVSLQDIVTVLKQIPT